MRMVEVEQYDPFDLGWIANKNVQDQGTNPFPAGSYEWEEWNDGWIAYRDYRPAH